MTETSMIGANEICTILSVKPTKAYEIIRNLNKELAAHGLLTVRGQVPARYFKHRFGLDVEDWGEELKKEESQEHDFAGSRRADTGGLHRNLRRA